MAAIQKVNSCQEAVVLLIEYTCSITYYFFIKGEKKYILQEAQVDIIPQSICNRYDWYGGAVTTNMFCAGSESGAVDSCQVKLKISFLILLP